MLPRSLFVGWCLMTMLPCAAAQSPAESQTVPFQLLPSRHILVRAKLNDKGPYQFIFDTGAPINLVSSRVARDAGLKKPGGFSLFRAPKPVEVQQLTLGTVSAAKIPVLVMDHPTVETISRAFEQSTGPIEGIIGYPFFARYALTVDYQKKQLLLKPNGHEPGDYLSDLIGRIADLSTQAHQPRITAPMALWGLEVVKPQENTSGVLVRTAHPQGAAAAGGLRKGDRILTIDDRWTDTVADTFRAVSLVKPGRKVSVLIERNGQQQTLVVTPKKGL
ncbi:MAG: PDZ domain-containing protein [Bacteroidales bacterium]|nr:PDZ domain-containing protein [Bacteroidales bacterium]